MLYRRRQRGSGVVAGCALRSVLCMVGSHCSILLCVSQGFLCTSLGLSDAFLFDLARPLCQELCTLLPLELLLRAGWLWK